MKAGSNKALPAGKSPMPEAAPKKSCLSEIQRLQRDRDERRRAMEQAKQERAAEEQRLRDQGMPGDVDFQRMIRVFRETQAPPEQAHVQSGDDKIVICIRKRPISQKEVKKHDYDSVTCSNPTVIVHDCKFKVDGISKYLDNTPFEFDHTFHEENTTEDIYLSAVQPLIDFVFTGGRATVFAYGQTGSGKTFTMQGIQAFAADDLFAALAAYEQEKRTAVQVFVSYFEIYGGRCQDLLNSRQRLNVREDGNNEVVVSDLMELEADSADALHAIIETGNRNRTTHATESNDESSRSHAICQIALKTAGKGGVEQLLGRLSLIDLAGSERGADTKSHNRQRRMEGAEINKSLLALKECIRALDSQSSHVPYRASKLTLVLKDSFTNKRSRTVMIAAVSPAASSADHTINTLRYADRIKEKSVGGQAAKNAALAAAAAPPAPAPAAPAQAMAPPPPSAASSAAAPRHYAARPAVAEQKPVSRQSPAPMAREQQYQQQQQQQQQQQYKGYAKEMPAEEEFFDDEYGQDADVEDVFHQTVQDIFDEEEDLLNMHMSVIQENAELLTEEGRLLQQIQGENNDIDAYAARLDQILTRKQHLINLLKEKLDHFRQSLQREEKYSRRLANMAQRNGY